MIKIPYVLCYTEEETSVHGIKNSVHQVESHLALLKRIMWIADLNDDEIYACISIMT